MSGEIRPLPGLVASASKKSPRLFIIFIIISIWGFGLVDRGPWRGADLYGVALVKNCIDAYHNFSSSCVVPNLYGAVVASDGPLFTWAAAFIIISIELLIQNLEVNINLIDDIGRVVQSFFVITGLIVLWCATKKLALRRESKPIDPLGVGPTSEKFSSNIADCSVLITIACLGLVMPLHELGNTGLNFMLQAIVFCSIVFAPENPKKAGAVFGITTFLLLLCSGIGCFISIYLAILIVCIKSYPWVLVRKEFLSYAVFFSSIVVVPLILNDFSWESEKLIRLWLHDQLAFQNFQPLFLIKTWLWTWWPLWPIATAFFIQAYKRGFLSLSHIQMPLILLSCSTLIPLLGIFVSEGTKFIPVIPLTVLAAFGLLSLPRNVANLIDYFALSIFTFLAIMIWIYWIALHTGTPEAIHNNVLRAAPGITGIYSISELFFGSVASLAWLMLIGWRVRVSEPLLWRPVILSAGGLGISWILLVSLWGPALEINRGYGEIIREINTVVEENPTRDEDICIGVISNDLKSRAIILANSNFRLNQSGKKKPSDCDFFLIRKKNKSDLNTINTPLFDSKKWELTWSGNRKADPRKKEIFFLYKKLNF